MEVIKQKDAALCHSDGDSVLSAVSESVYC